MTTLILAPDFYSHYQPLAVIAAALRRHGERVIMATGPSMGPVAERDGLEWRHVQLAAGSNDGVASARTHDPGDPGSLDAFIDATRQGFVATLRLQAQKRSRELLWNPVEVGSAIVDLLDDVEPDHVVVDHVSLVSTLGLVASGRPFTTVVPGHPTQLPVAGEAYGDAIAWPDALQPDRSDLEDLAVTVRRVNELVTAEFNGALAHLAPSAAAVGDAFACHGDRVAYHWEQELHDPARATRLPASRVDLGPLVRTEELPPELAAVTHGRRPLVVVAFGTFLVHRRDVLENVVRAVERVGARAVVALGPHRPDDLGPIPADWIVAPRIPQVALLAHADLLVSHGGNGSVQEALRAGVAQLVLPMSTDQMAIAADLVRCGRAVAADPNRASVEDVAAAVELLLGAPRPTPVRAGIDELVEFFVTDRPA
jgi:zeaxanthin glucosyltransferase